MELILIGIFAMSIVQFILILCLTSCTALPYVATIANDAVYMEKNVKNNEADIDMHIRSKDNSKQ